MADEDLEQLARHSASARQFVLAVVLSIGFAVGLGVAMFKLFPGVSVKGAAGVMGGGMFVGMMLALRVRTPPHRFPSIRVLRDRPQDVAHIVAVSRGKQHIALVGADGKILAKPLVLKTTSRYDKHRGEQAKHVMQLMQQRCPRATTASVTDTWGLGSMAKLVRKALEPK